MSPAKAPKPRGMTTERFARKIALGELTPAQKPPEGREASAAAAGISLALAKIEAAAWLLDQIKVGELGFLKQDGEPPCWLSTVEGSADNLADTLEHWAIGSISREVQEIRREFKIACPEVAS